MRLAIVFGMCAVLGGGAYGNKAEAQIHWAYTTSNGTVISEGDVASEADIPVDVGEVSGVRYVRVYDSSFSGTPDSDAGKITITGTLATGTGHELRILVAGPTQAWISDLTLPIAQVGVQHLGLTGEVGIEVDDPALRAKTRLLAYISGNLRGSIAVGQVRRIQAGIPGETPTGNITASVTSVGNSVPMGELPPESPFGYVVAGNSISGTMKAELGNIDRVQVGPNTAAAGISGDIIAQAGAIKSIFSTGPIGNGTSTLMRISAANGIGQIRTAASDTGTILARRIEAQIVAHEAFLSPTPPTLNDPASDGVLSILETAGDLRRGVWVG